LFLPDIFYYLDLAAHQQLLLVTRSTSDRRPGTQQSTRRQETAAEDTRRDLALSTHDHCPLVGGHSSQGTRSNPAGP